MPQNKDFEVRNGIKVAGGSLAANSTQATVGVPATFSSGVSMGSSLGVNGAATLSGGVTVTNGIDADSIDVNSLTVGGQPYVAGGTNNGGTWTAPQTYTIGTTTLTNSSSYSVFNCSASSGSVTLPSTSGLSQGWTVIVRFTNTNVNSYQALRITAQSANGILFNGTSMTNFYTIGRGEAFQITFLGSQFWIQCVHNFQVPSNSSIVSGLLTSSDNTFYTLQPNVTFSGQSITQFGGFQLNGGSLQVPVTGVYNIQLKGYFDNYNSNTTYLVNAILNGTAYYQVPILGSAVFVIDQGFGEGSVTMRLNQGDIIGMQAATSSYGSGAFQPVNSQILALFVSR